MPISSAKDLFSHALALPALRSQHDLFIMLRCNGLATNHRSVALAASGEGYNEGNKKPAWRGLWVTC
ncbi:hypothetical protein [Pseudocitrobacter sp. 73]|uniref:hypothetical protein n=1 Tax=Pseudocitrobacter sp. 73 TaxID=2605731 RepID=UPI0011EC1D33|nr:hypothetical protein [Pseudocitrobacter sp. 73]KAA1047295.1 hypothetical protein F0Q32_20475 [Pseudocitrobacter sp. 73]